MTNLQQNMPTMQLAMFVCYLNPSCPLFHDACKLIMQKLISHPPKNGAYTELFAAFSPTLTEKDNGGWVSPFGKVEPARKDLLQPDLGSKVWEWSMAQVQQYL